MAEPTITSAHVVGEKVVCIGSRVKHAGQAYTGRATATVSGFRDVGHASPHADGKMRLPFWIKILVEHDTPGNAYDFADGWDWDRTVLVDEPELVS